MPARRPLTFIDGIGVGIGAIAILPMLVLAIATGIWEDMYRQMGPGAHLPALTILAFSWKWRIGAPVVVAIAFAGVLVRRPHPIVTIGVALGAIVVAIVWIVALYQPIWSLAGNIR